MREDKPAAQSHCLKGLGWHFVTATARSGWPSVQAPLADRNTLPNQLDLGTVRARIQAVCSALSSLFRILGHEPACRIPLWAGTSISLFTRAGAEGLPGDGIRP